VKKLISLPFIKEITVFTVIEIQPFFILKKKKKKKKKKAKKQNM
jgi:hypothetical protein